MKLKLGQVEGGREVGVGETECPSQLLSSQHLTSSCIISGIFPPAMSALSSGKRRGNHTLIVMWRILKGEAEKGVVRGPGVGALWRSDHRLDRACLRAGLRRP